MANSVLKRRIKEIVNDLNMQEKDICVLKGLPIYLVDNDVQVDISKLISDKFGYFMNLVNNRKFITYEEFLLLNSFIISQYKNIYILNNNIYMELYPIERQFPIEIEEGLLYHFNESGNVDDDTIIGDIEEYVSIFNGLRKTDQCLICSYCESSVVDSNKVQHINIFADQNSNINYLKNGNNNFVDIIEESDYVNFVKTLFEEPDAIVCRVSNYIGDRELLTNHIYMLVYYWSDITDISFLQIETYDDEFDNRDEYTRYLKKYWEVDSFRELSIYDMIKLEDGIKDTKKISQVKIISDLVNQSEKAQSNTDFRDIFITAPTGAGKSVMFQIPAMYLAEKYNLLTIVISPLIGLMNDQVKNLEDKNYKNVKTINSDISPIVKGDISNRVAEGEYHILYISPETLLSRSDVENLIGNREIGLIIIDESHIVTTWGKQFRPDYWYLGDHIRKLRKEQIAKKGKAFVIATFTATSIYHGLEDMYTETVNSLHLINPITYLGYIKRSDIEIVIRKEEKKKDDRSEYELDKFNKIVELIKRSKITNKKILIYFPTVVLINRCFEYLRNIQMIETVSVYFGTLAKEKKEENYDKFLRNEKKVMLATKAFGMGIDIDDIEIVYHFAPTGNVCDFVQEIGRAARRTDINGEALYDYDKRDFKHINRLHGLSTIQRYQLIEVVRKIDELYSINLQNKGRDNYTKRRNAMLLDAENFTYIFGKSIDDEDNNINKVKTALLIIQKDFENKVGFSPITVRPIPLFSIGFFKVDKKNQSKLLRKYPDCLEEINEEMNICRIYLDRIWNKKYKDYSFPKFKYLLYSKNEELSFNKQFDVIPTLCVTIEFTSDYISKFGNMWNIVKNFINKKVLSSEFTSLQELINELVEKLSISMYKAQTISEVLIASMDTYRKKVTKDTSPIVKEKSENNGVIKYQFNVAVNSYMNWVEKMFRKIINSTRRGKLYLINDKIARTNEMSTILGLLESMNILDFEMLGGTNSQLYIYINQIQALKNILNNPSRYENRLLNMISDRHLISVKMLTYLYESGLDNTQLWDTLEDYFLGSIPEIVKQKCLEVNKDINF